MARTFNARRLANMRNMDRRLAEEHRRMGQIMGEMLLEAADENGIIPNDGPTRKRLKRRMWEEVIRPYYIGPGDSPFGSPTPRSPYASLLVGGITEATRIEAEREAALLWRYVDDREITGWLTEPRPSGAAERFQTGLRDPFTGRVLERKAKAMLVRPIGMAPEGAYDPFHKFVDPNGHTLSDRVWNTGKHTRARIDKLVDYHVGRGTSAVDAAKELEQFLTPGARGIKTRRPYGREGSFSARRLLRTEISAASGRAAMAAADANPLVNRMRWQLSPSHPRIDHCDDNAAGGPLGNGTYLLSEVPRFPDHPHCCLPGQLVQTDRGDVPIEEVRDGDQVLTHKGRYRRVLAAWSTAHDAPVYEFITERGRFELTGNHPVLTRRGWVYAEHVQLGDQVLYAGVNVAPDDPAMIAEGDPTPRGKPVISQPIPFGIPAMPAVPITFDGNLVLHHSKIDNKRSHTELFFKWDSMPSQAIAHHDFDIGPGRMTAEALSRAETSIGMAFLDTEWLPAMLAVEDDAILYVRSSGIGLEISEAGVVLSFRLGDFAPNFGALGAVGFTGKIALAIDGCEQGASSNTARAVVLLPTGSNSVAHTPHGDVMQGEKIAKDAVGDSVLLVDLSAGKSLYNVDVMQQISDGAIVFVLKADSVGFHRGHSDNLLSLSPESRVGHGSGNPFVSEIANPTQAHIHYTPIRAIHQRHYTGPVYNMEVADDHSYTVNGAACHNCLCSLIPVPDDIRDRSIMLEEMRESIRQAKQGLFDALPAKHAEALKGILNPDFLTNSIIEGTLEENIFKAVRTGGKSRVIPPSTAAFFDEVADTDTLTAAQRQRMIEEIEKFPMPDADDTYTDEALQAARVQIENAALEEPRLTATISNIADRYNGEMHGLEFRQKGQGSAARKITADMVAAQKEGLVLTATEAEESISDYTRYTIVASKEKLVWTTSRVMRDLEEAGYTVFKQKNFFKPGNPYRGYNTQFLDEVTGIKFELQFHTHQSIAIKEQSHVLFERMRLMADGPELKRWEEVSRKLWNTVESPDFWEYLPGDLIDLTTDIEGRPRTGWDKIGYRPETQNEIDVIREYRKELARDAQSMNMTVEELELKLFEVARPYLDKPPAIRARPDAAGTVMEQGRFKTQFETGASSGHYDPDIRAEAENFGLGVPRNIPRNKLPIYGYFPGSGRRVSHYGSVEFRMKPEVRVRTTYTVEDSLNPFLTKRAIAAPVSEDNLSAFGGGYAPMNSEDEFIGYIEAQIHGGVSMDDVEEIILHFNPRDGDKLYAVSDAAEAKGISVTWMFQDRPIAPPPPGRAIGFRDIEFLDED